MIRMPSALKAAGLFYFADSDLKLDQPQATLVVDRDKIAFRSGGAVISRDDPVAVAPQMPFGRALAAPPECNLSSKGS